MLAEVALVPPFATVTGVVSETVATWLTVETDIPVPAATEATSDTFTKLVAVTREVMPFCEIGTNSFPVSGVLAAGRFAIVLGTGGSVGAGLVIRLNNCHYHKVTGIQFSVRIHLGNTPLMLVL